MHLPIDALPYHTIHHTTRTPGLCPAHPHASLAPLHLCVPSHAPEIPATLSHSLYRWASHGITQCHVHGIAEHHMHGASHGAWHRALHAGQGRLMQASQRPRQSTVGHCVASQSTTWHCRASCGIVDHRVGHHRASHRVPQGRASHHGAHAITHTLLC